MNRESGFESMETVDCDTRSVELCPYSEPPYKDFTNDHIFPQFLGGRRTIRVCRECNNTFGHSFEGVASNQLKRMQVFISHFGLDLSGTMATWPKALTIEDVTYDLISGPEGVQYALNKPVIIRDNDGSIVGGKARSMAEARKISKAILATGNKKEVEIRSEPGSTLEDIQLKASFSFDPSLFRFATKLASAVVIAAAREQLILNSGIPAYLHRKGDWSTRVAICDVSSVSLLRSPLVHTVYVELGLQSYAIVLIFGFSKIFVPLPAYSSNRGLLATLDPITGEEDFREVEPIGPIVAPHSVSPTEMLLHLQQMHKTLTEEAVSRGAKHPPNLQILSTNLPESRQVFVTDSTLRFMKILS